MTSRQIEVITSVQRRRRWGSAEKQRLVAATLEAGAGQLGEALCGVVGRHWSVVDLTADRSLKHGRVDEGGFGMRVTRRVAAWAVFDEHAP